MPLRFLTGHACVPVQRGMPETDPNFLESQLSKVAQFVPCPNVAVYFALRFYGLVTHQHAHGCVAFLCLHRFCGSSSATLVSKGSARPCSWHFRSRTRSSLETLLAYSVGNALTSSRYGRTSHAAWALEATPVAGVARTNAALHGAPEAPRLTPFPVAHLLRCVSALWLVDGLQ